MDLYYITSSDDVFEAIKRLSKTDLLKCVRRSKDQTKRSILKCVSAGFHVHDMMVVDILFENFFLVDIDFNSKIIKINQSDGIEKFKDILQSNSKLFQSVCKFGVSTRQAILSKLNFSAS